MDVFLEKKARPAAGRRRFGQVLKVQVHSISAENAETQLKIDQLESK